MDIDVRHSALLVAGFPCTDISALNNNRSQFSDAISEGSGSTGTCDSA